MVAKVTTGPGIRAALLYNERKLEKGKADLILANLYHKDIKDMDFPDKIFRLQHQADLSFGVKHVCMHISISFDPSEKFGQAKFRELAVSYMQKMGMSGQPYLVYRHSDTANPHLHIVSTTILPDGKQMHLHNIGKTISFQACREIEQENGLVKATEKRKRKYFSVPPADLKAIEYGAAETKHEIGKALYTVLKYYKFSSFHELNAVLNNLNITAYQGEKGSRMHDKGGIVYSLIDHNKQRVGNPIKASSYYYRPILSELQKKFDSNKAAKKGFKDQTFSRVSNAIESSSDKATFIEILRSENVVATFRTNQNGLDYGVTFIDNNNCCVFNGSDLDKSFGVKSLLQQISNSKSDAKDLSTVNKTFVDQTLATTNYPRGFAHVIADWILKGMRILPTPGPESDSSFILGNRSIPEHNYLDVPVKYEKYLRANGFTKQRAHKLDQVLNKPRRSPMPPFPPPDAEPVVTLRFLSTYILPLINGILQSEDSDPVDSHWLQEAYGKKRRKRKNL